MERGFPADQRGCGFICCLHLVDGALLVCSARFLILRRPAPIHGPGVEAPDLETNSVLDRSYNVADGKVIFRNHNEKWELLFISFLDFQMFYIIIVFQCSDIQVTTVNELNEEII